MSDNIYTPPQDLWEMNANLQFNDALESTDKRYVDTISARGDFSLRTLYRRLGVDTKDEARPVLRHAPPRSYTVFCGHRGCGKSTELRRITRYLHENRLFFVIFMDVLEELDYNNLNYADVLLALAKDLFEKLAKEAVHVDALLLQNLEDWFHERVETDERAHSFAAEIKAGAEVGSGIPFLGKIFGKMTSSVKNNSHYKQEIRRIVENSFSQFAESFNRCLVAVEDALQRNGKGQKLLFIVDGTDRLSGEESTRFFIRDVNQLQQIDANFIYGAPIHLVHEGNQLQQDFGHVVLPMIKLHEKNDEEKRVPAYQAMREMINRRAAPSLFADQTLLDTLICYSGGNPRELFKLLHYAFLIAEGEQLEKQDIDKAVNKLATDYKRILDTEDYPLLISVDYPSDDSDQNSPRIRHCLYHLFLLEYNGYWRQTHPVIRTLPAYHNLLPTHVTTTCAV